MNTKIPLRGLYAITDSSLIPRGQIADYVRLALRGGAALVQYRDKGTDAARREQEVRALLDLCRAHGVPLIINDDVRLAQATGADGVHLGKEDNSLAYARERLGAQAIIGVSCYGSMELALQAQAGGADYVAFGSFYPSQTKPQAIPVAIEVLIEARARLQLPVTAIGGITPERGRALIQAGADLLAVVHGIFGRPDIYAATQHYARLFTHKD